MKAGSFFKRLKTMAGAGESKAAQDQAPVTLSAPVRFPYGAFRFKAQLAAGYPYEIQATTNLKNWISIFTGVATGEAEYLDSNAAKFSYRFYRVIAAGVLSANVVGYATLRVPPGFALIANPLHTPDNSVTELFKGLPDGARLSKYDSRIARMTENSLKQGKWSEPLQQLVPGEGVMVFNPTSDDLSLNFAGDVRRDSFLLPIPAGFSMLSSPMPQAGRLHEDLGFPSSEGDVVHLYDRDKQKYVPYQFDGTAWSPEPPIVGVGEGFLAAKQLGMNWQRGAIDAGDSSPLTPAS